MGAIAKSLIPQNLREPEPLQPIVMPESAPQPLPPTPQPQVQLAPKVPTPLDQQIQHDQQKLQKIHFQQENPWGTANNHPGVGGKIAHVLSVAGNIAGDIFAPGVMARIPGTQMNRQVEEDETNDRLSKEQEQQSQGAERQANTEHLNAETPEVAPNAASLRNYQGAEVEHLNAQTDALNNPPPNLANAYAFAVDRVIKAGGDPAQDPIVQHLSDAITSLQKQPAPRGLAHVTLEGPGGKPIAANYNSETGKYTDVNGQEILNPRPYEKPSAVPGITVMVPGPNGTQTVQRLTPGQTITPGTQDLKAGLGAPRQDVREHDKTYVQPAEQVEKSYAMMDHAYQEYENARKQGKQLPTGAQSMLALSTHLSTTFGNVKGARVTKDMIHEHLGARSIGDDALVAVQKLTNGDQLSPQQWDAFHDLIRQSRNLSWNTAVKEAARKHIPIDFLPPDLQTINKNGVNYTMGQDGQYHKQGGE
jgi:hypothetical protein